ncbi:MAG: hypothetical protein U0446_11900 [Dehalococcoidia bacterium]
MVEMLLQGGGVNLDGIGTATGLVADRHFVVIRGRRGAPAKRDRERNDGRAGDEHQHQRRNDQRKRRNPLAGMRWQRRRLTVRHRRRISEPRRRD